jgi:hypothetical protein
MREALDFDAINQAALTAFPAVLNRLLPRGKAMGRELVAFNPNRFDRNLGSFKINRHNGKWCDFATGDKGGDPVSLVAYLAGVNQGEAAHLLACSGSKPGRGAMDNPLDAFAPLTEAELADAARQVPQDLEADAPKPTCPPPDAENGVLAAARLFGRKPDMSWRYETAEGETAFCIARWDEGADKKTFRPVSWREEVGWQLTAWPNKRPLHNLLAIAEQSNSGIVVCEGEKSADAAALIFPKSIATTSSGEAKAFDKTDWKPLPGRRVLIWPDHDEAGGNYAREVAAILADLGCEVSIIDAAALITQIKTPNPDGFDAADALDEMPDVWALRKLAASLAKPFDPGPRYQSWGSFTMTAKGLEVEKTEGRGEARKTVCARVSGPFEILGRAAIRRAAIGAYGYAGATATGGRTKSLFPSPRCTARRRPSAKASPPRGFISKSRSNATLPSI